MFCKKCGTKNDLTDKFCKNCGTPLENIQTSKESEFEKVAKKKNNPILVILGIVVLVGVLYFGRQIPERIANQKTNQITFSGYSFEIPEIYEANIKDNTMTIVSDLFESQEAIGIRIYSTGYDKLVSEMKELASRNDTIYNLETKTYEKEEYIIADYETGDYKGAVVLKEAADNNVFWVQTISKSTTRGREILNDFIPVIINAKKTGQTSSDSGEEISVSIMNKLKEIIQNI